MKIMILGATGNVGSRVLAQAAEAGHDVVAYARTAAAVSPRRGVRVVEGTAEDSAALGAAARGVDAILVSITGSPTDATFMQRALPNVIAAARQAGVSRLVLVSAFGAGDTAAKASGFARLIYRGVLRRFFTDKAAADQLMESSGLDWTIVYPVNLKAAPALAAGPVVKPLEQIGRVPGLPTLPFDDAARALLAVVTDPSTVGERLVVTTPRGWTSAE
ncbi:NAD(P)-dependent oxidoreductase [Mycetocola reblochoni]|uniref:NAD(P)-dependent oxidoreductase n=1 Tax=Mycetocola reblochoni TaxID=331618 RepID=A0A3L6ZNP9_9MICO|nr:NAD(P)-binding oxidoreductase [Mycetocola reblochoni]RLP69285.1 NAD(P)-dependent oxidoreductase [Mycetocola reblochoni]